MKFTSLQIPVVDAITLSRDLARMILEQADSCCEVPCPTVGKKVVGHHACLSK